MIIYACPIKHTDCGEFSDSWCPMCPKKPMHRVALLKAQGLRLSEITPEQAQRARDKLYHEGVPGVDGGLKAIVNDTTSAKPSELSATPELKYQVGVSRAMQVLIDWQAPVRHIALDPDQALILSGHLKRVANLAIAARKRVKKSQRDMENVGIFINEKGGATIDKL